MTMPRRIDVPCPKCGHVENVITYLTINTAANPGLRQGLFNDEVNLFRCSKCGLEEIVLARLLYHDPTLRFCVQFYPWGSVDEDLVNSFERQWPPTPRLPSMAPAEYLAQPHVVFDWEEMLRSIVFFEAVLGRTDA
jgi:predicted RNA-binding Zn-ribbon protein involved in translation (DUF1610 family)